MSGLQLSVPRRANAHRASRDNLADLWHELDALKRSQKQNFQDWHEIGLYSQEDYVEPRTFTRRQDPTHRLRKKTLRCC